MLIRRWELSSLMPAETWSSRRLTNTAAAQLRGFRITSARSSTRASEASARSAARTPVITIPRCSGYCCTAANTRLRAGPPAAHAVYPICDASAGVAPCDWYMPWSHAATSAGWRSARRAAAVCGGHRPSVSVGYNAPVAPSASSQAGLSTLPKKNCKCPGLDTSSRTACVSLLVGCAVCASLSSASCRISGGRNRLRKIATHSAHICSMLSWVLPPWAAVSRRCRRSW